MMTVVCTGGKVTASATPPRQPQATPAPPINRSRRRMVPPSPQSRSPPTPRSPPPRSDSSRSSTPPMSPLPRSDSSRSSAPPPARHNDGEVQTMIRTLRYHYLFKVYIPMYRLLHLQSRRNEREEIRRKLAMGVDEDYYGGERAFKKPNLQTRLQGGMNLQICFMNDATSDQESLNDDTEQDTCKSLENSPPSHSNPAKVSQL